MATIDISSFIDMHSVGTWYGVVISYDANHITIGNGALQGTYYGYFGYDIYGDVYGTLTGISESYHGASILKVTGLDMSASYAAQLINANQIQQLLQVALSGNDDFFVSPGTHLIDGYGGFNTVTETQSYSNYALYYSGSGTEIVGGSTQDLLYNIQRIDFADGVYNAQTRTFSPNVLTPPLLQDIAVRGTHSQYEIGLDPTTGKPVVQDSVAGRDGSQSPANLHDIIFADGVGRFDATGNAEEAARLYQAALGRAPDATGLDYWTAQLDSHTLNMDGVALGFINSAEFSSKYGLLDNTRFVVQLYQNVLHRASDPSGEQYWIGQLDSGTSRAAVLVGFSDSLENKINTQGAIGDPHMDEAYRLYQAAFNRTPDMPGLSYWTGRLDNGTTPLEVAQGFVGSSEFAQLFAGVDTKGFVDRMYQNVLHRAPDAAGEQYWIGQVNQGTSKGQALLGFSDSLENRLNTSQATHDGWVFLAAS